MDFTHVVSAPLCPLHEAPAPLSQRVDEVLCGWPLRALEPPSRGWVRVSTHYGYSGFVETVRSGSAAAATGLNAECDAIAACVIGGVSFVGGTGKISGSNMGVFVLRLIFVALTMLGVDSSSMYIIKGAIILCACALDMRKYLVKK